MMSDFEDVVDDYSMSESEEEFDDEMEEMVSDNEEGDGVVLDSDDGDLMKTDKNSDYFLVAGDAKVLSTESIIEEMEAIVSEVSAIIGISENAICRVLLHKFTWKKESLIERFYEAADTNSFLRTHHALPEKENPIKTPTSGECDICCEMAELGGPSCNHLFCASCWNRYITIKIMDGNCGMIECIEPECKLIMDDEVILSYIRSETTKKMFRRLIIDSFVQTNPRLKWCPAPDCGRAIKASNCEESRSAICSCGKKFCFGCRNDWHAPLNCRLLQEWLKKCSDDSETGNWIMANTKDCPKCFTAIEKNGGCNHMTCNSSGCRYQFCWICMGPWNNHGSSACNRYVGSEESMNTQEKSRAALERYLHYSNRFLNHQKSLELENKLYTLVEGKMAEMQAFSMSWIEVQFLKKAVDVLSECRRTLMYTYGFAYYLKRSIQVDIFEGNQSDLEMATENLSEILERDLHHENLVSLKQKVQDQSRYLDKRRLVLLRHYVEGVEGDFWTFTE